MPFPFTKCPPECSEVCGKHATGCPTYKKLPKGIQEKCQANPHLLQYLHGLPLSKIGIPEYFSKLNRSMKGLRNPNLLYPVTDNVFVHILTDGVDIRDNYIPVEPCLYEPMDNVLKSIEERLADHVGDMEDVEPERRFDMIAQLIERVVMIRNPNAGAKASFPSEDRQDTQSKGGTAVAVKTHKDTRAPAHNANVKTKTGIKVALTTNEYERARYLMQRKLEGFGVLEPLIRDTNIEDISCSGLGQIFVEHKVFGGLKATMGFATHDELDEFVVQLAEEIKHPITFRNPCVDATLPDGSRINIVYGIDVSKRGSNFTIRKFSQVPMSILEVIQGGSLTYEMAAYLSLVIQEGMNLWVAGETASGKTTLINAITTFIPPENKIVSIEDTPEIQVPHPNWIRGVTRGTGKNAESSEVTMFDLLKAALRQRPNMIIVGEIRGAEGAIAFQAMQSGHSCMSTFHAASVAKLIQRLTGNPINIPKSYVDNLNVVIIAQQVRLPNGSLGRRVTSINEIVGYDSVADTFSFIESFGWDPTTDKFTFRGHMNSYLLEEKIARKRGIPYEKRQQIYQQLEHRAKVLQRLAEQKVTGFYELHAMLQKAYREGFFR